MAKFAVSLGQKAGDQVGTPKGLAMEVTSSTSLLAPSSGTCELLPADSVPEILLGPFMWESPAGTQPGARPRREARVSHKPQCLYKLLRHREPLLTNSGGTLPPLPPPEI